MGQASRSLSQAARDMQQAGQQGSEQAGQQSGQQSGSQFVPHQRDGKVPRHDGGANPKRHAQDHPETPLGNGNLNAAEVLPQPRVVFQRVLESADFHFGLAQRFPLLAGQTLRQLVQVLLN